MKTSKAPLKKSDQGKCGVWLDTAELKGKAKQKRLARPISKLLNPFLEGGGYNVAVALNFTQTKLEMPKTKQSSIWSFFVPQRKDVKKMSTSGNVVTPSASAPSSRSPGPRGTKRSRDVDLDASSSEPAWLRNLEGKTGDEEEFWQEPTENPTPVPNLNREDTIHSPQSKRRVFANSSLLNDCESHGRARSQDPLLTFREYSQGRATLKEHNGPTAEAGGPSEPQVLSQEAWGVHLDVAATTSTQKSLKGIHSTLLDDDKENTKFGLFGSPNPKRARSPSPPKYIPVHPRKAHRESQFKCTKPRGSPVQRSQLSCMAEEDSLGLLFTQDSEGFRVIAHGGPPGPSPLEPHARADANAGASGSARKSLSEEEEEEMLFTQDSQGNVVIKH